MSSNASWKRIAGGRRHRARKAGPFTGGRVSIGAMTQSESPTSANPPRARLVTVGADHAGQRLDNFLVACFRDVPKARIYRSVRTGEVRVSVHDGEPAYDIVDDRAFDHIDAAALPGALGLPAPGSLRATAPMSPVPTFTWRETLLQQSTPRADAP